MNRSSTNMNKSSPNVHSTVGQDLDIDNYSLEELYHLFGIKDLTQKLTDDVMKSAKQVVLKTHPDKSKLDSSYFLFFSKAYKRLHGIYEFSNKSSTKKSSYAKELYNDDQHGKILNKFIKSSKLTDPKEFNNWFNAKFDEHRTENPCEDGHGEWLKSDEAMVKIDEPVTKVNMNAMFEQQKRQMQSISVYTGVVDPVSSTLGASFLDSGASSSQYADLKEAFTETLFPVGEDDYKNIPKYSSVDEYAATRQVADSAPVNYATSQSVLERQAQSDNREGARTAFNLARQLEKAETQQSLFWGTMNRLT